MRSLFVLAAVAALHATPSMARCSASYEASALARSSDYLAQVARYELGYERVGTQAGWLASAAQQLEQEAYYARSCRDLVSSLRSGVERAYDATLREYQRAQVRRSPYVAQAWNDVSRAYTAVRQAVLNGGGNDPWPQPDPHPWPQPDPNPWPNPNPWPQPSACGQLAGYYSGVCRSNAGTSAISFVVSEQHGACLVSQSPYFQPAYLQVSGYQGTAAVQQIPGGVAIQNSYLTVYGYGRFTLTGYNYAGRFQFTCN